MAEALLRLSRPLHHRQRPTFRPAGGGALVACPAECAFVESTATGLEKKDRYGERASYLRALMRTYGGNQVKAELNDAFGGVIVRGSGEPRPRPSSDARRSRDRCCREGGSRDE